jgi:hypothetical protein
MLGLIWGALTAGATEPPYVGITTPSDGGVLLTPASIQIEAAATNSDSTVVSVQFYDGTVSLGQAASSPWLQAWATPKPGIHVLTAVAADVAGLRSTSAPVNVTVVLTAASQWVAYNDHNIGANTSPRATTWNPFGTSGGAPGTTGPLTNIATGAALPVRLAVTQVNCYAGSAGGAPAPGTPADLLFSGFTDWTNCSSPVIVVSNGSVLRHTFTGLDPSKRYRFKGTGVRGVSTYTNRWALFELTGAASFTNDHTAGVLTEARLSGQLGPAQAVMLTGVNTAGDVVGWGDIDPGPDGSFAVTSRQFLGSVPGSSTAGAHAYGFQAVRLEETAGPAAVAITSPTNGATLDWPTSALVTVSASSAGGITNVQVFANGVSVGASTTPPHAVVWSGGNRGSNGLVAVATDAWGLAATSAVVAVTLAAPPQPRVILVASNAIYRWRPGTNEASSPPDAWRGPGFDDSGWAAGQAPFYYDNSPTVQSTYTGNTLITGMRSNYSCVFLRHAFVLPNATLFTNLSFRFRGDDGFVTWLNGVEVCRYNMNGWNGTFNDMADKSVTEPLTNTLVTLAGFTPLQCGTNILAFQVFNDDLASSDLLLEIELSSDQLDPAFLPPVVERVSPSTGRVTSMTEVAVQFSKPVTNIYATDLMVNGVAATSLAGSNGAWTFSFPQPVYGPVLVSWSAAQAIQDLAQPPVAFVSTGLVWQYYLINPEAPVISGVDPVPGAMLTNLTGLTVTFSKAVSGVQAGDLLLNGAPATAVTGGNATYTFAFAQPGWGPVSVRWASGHGIADLAQPLNAFDANLPEASWQYVLADLLPPRVASQSPPAGSLVTNLTELTVVFSEQVTNVRAGDLLLNGSPATGVTGSGQTFRFTFPSPNGSTIRVSWAADNVITDLEPVSHRFDASVPGAAWEYAAEDMVRPQAANVYPPAGLRLRELGFVRVTFDEPVQGVSASALLINGQPAQQVYGSGAGPYEFRFAQPAAGPVLLDWASVPPIRDLAPGANALASGPWSYMLDPSASATMVVSHVVHISVDGLGGAYLRNYFSNGPANFPNLARLAREGAGTLNARTDNDSTVTIPNHACQLTGRPVLQPDGQPNTVHHGYTGDTPTNGENLQVTGNLNIPYKASILDVVHDHGLSTAFYASKAKFSFYRDSWDAVRGAADAVPPDDGPNKIDYSLLMEAENNLYGASEALVDSLTQNLTNLAKNYSFLHFAEPDYAGHASGWGSPTWSNAVRHVDQQLGRIFEAIDSTPALSNRVAIILTADHGGGGNTATGHSTITRYTNFAIPFFLWAPGVPGGIELHALFNNRADLGTARADYTAAPQPIRNGDAANLAASLLGLPPVPGSLILPERGAPSVLVAVSNTGPAIEVSWPQAAVDFQLETSDAIGPSPAWVPVFGPLTTNGSRVTCTIPASTGEPPRFFRLRRYY